jgi:hypothetical protein
MGCSEEQRARLCCCLGSWNSSSIGPFGPWSWRRRPFRRPTPHASIIDPDATPSWKPGPMQSCAGSEPTLSPEKSRSSGTPVCAQRPAGPIPRVRSFRSIRDCAITARLRLIEHFDTSLRICWLTGAPAGGAFCRTAWNGRRPVAISKSETKRVVIIFRSLSGVARRAIATSVPIVALIFRGSARFAAPSLVSPVAENTIAGDTTTAFA